jgi:hypothetical protein
VPPDWLAGAETGVRTGVARTHREVALEELLLLWLENANPACARYRELFDDTALARATAYAPAMRALEAFLATRPRLAITGSRSRSRCARRCARRPRRSSASSSSCAGRGARSSAT